MRTSLQTPVWVAAIFLAASLVTGCATVPEDPDDRAAFEEANDPIEPANRRLFAFNQGVDRIIVRPLAEAYAVVPERARRSVRNFLNNPVVPERARRSVRNFLNNLRTPVIFANDVFQAEVSRAGVTLGRFAINSTIGVAGLFDVATRMGLEFHDEDFGQTLAVWGIPEGPYIVLPIFGPSNPRDTIGMIADTFLDPLTYVASNNDVEYGLAIRSVVDGVDRRSTVLETLDEIERTSLDFYATIRSLYRQRRANEVANGEMVPEVPGPTIISEDGEEAPAPPLAPDRAAL
jgi:phospholipid-binding lipoprotein MlaA